jgi:hypothetical protein
MMEKNNLRKGLVEEVELNVALLVPTALESSMSARCKLQTLTGKLISIFVVCGKRSNGEDSFSYNGYS